MSPIVTVHGKKIKLTNLEKVMYPKTGFTKAEVIDYYRQSADYILPHLKDRLITLKRFPDGVEGDFFYEKKCPSHRPDWISTGGKEQMNKDYCVINDLPSLIWVANLASLEIHTLLSTVGDLERPSMVVFDLDPGAPANLSDCLEIALVMREMLERISLKSFAKTSGGKGLHVYVPLNTFATFEQTRFFAKAVAQTMEKAYPDRVVSKMTKRLREGKVFIDWSQNSQHKTTVCVYSLRAQPTPTVSMPLRWEQVQWAVDNRNSQDLIADAETAVRLLHEHGDLFSDVLKLRQTLSTGKSKSSGKSADSESLRTYQEKRDFEKSPEPSSGTGSGGQIFVIQKHAARRLHYDLRLEAEGVLKSWAVPKGPSFERSEKRLAVQVEDHPFDYKDFEGEIPAGEYGAGNVIIWDRGRYENFTRNSKKQIVEVPEAIRNGKLEIEFHGQKVKGRYTLVRMKGEEDSKNWLLIKKK